MKNFVSKNAFFIAAGAFLLLAAVFSMLVYSAFFQLGSRNESGYQPGETPIYNAEGTLIATDGSPIEVEPTKKNPAPVMIDEPEPWDGTKRVTMLLMGVDYRDWESNELYSRTDTMILLTIDPVTKTAGILSIPRDLWAAIPGFNPAKINTAHYYGDLYKYPGGGPALAVKTVENVIGVHIDYYAKIDFQTFVDFIDAIYGVPVTVTETIELEIIGQAYDEVLEPGYYALDGELALAYARNRYNKGGDFDRSRRQQQVIMGIRQRLLTPEVWRDLIPKAPALYEKFKDGIVTNLPFEDALRLAALAVKIKDENIKMAVINEQQVQFGKSPDNLSILIPLPDKIREVRDDIFATGGAFTPLTLGDPLVQMQSEVPRVTIYDGTSDNTTAQRTADYLSNLGVTVVSVQPADRVYTYTSIIDHTGSPYTMSYLADLMGVSTYQVYSQFSAVSDTDVDIWLGTQWQNNNSLP
ncbi:MAG TPA: LCP family protein [Anaerolineales bacterium]|nr:LCP family protein [Anaerolineales bacterium]